VLYDGVLVGILGDFLGESLIVKHAASDAGTTEFCTIYGHTVPRSDLCIGRVVKQGETIATVADVGRSRSGVSPHLHISMGLASGTISYGELDWGAIADPGIMTLVDPLPFIDRCCVVSGTTAN
jgi:murein DD-endopeptidase MepM/ murein hydrolase activator NlpD